MKITKSIILVILAIGIISLLVACSNSSEPKTTACSLETKQCPDGSMISRDPANNCEYPSCPVKQTEVTTANSVKTQPTKVPNDPAVDAIISRIADLKSYEYLDSKSGLVILVKGDKRVFITNDPNQWAFGKNTYNTIFQDDKAKTAVAACIVQQDNRNAFNCAGNLKTYAKVDYPVMVFDDPFAVFNDMENGKVVSTQACEKRQCDIIEYTKEGKKYKLFARKTYVLPYKVFEIESDGTEKLLVSYTNPAFDHLSDSDVTLPNGLIEAS